MKKKSLLVLLVFIFFGCSDKRLIEISGKTMGTTYNIKIVGTKKYPEGQVLKSEIDKILRKINSSMSIYDSSSTISVFNRLEKNVELTIENEFLDVLKVGQQIYDSTEGYWDATIGSLVDLWGFGTGKKEFEFPDKKELEKKLSTTGFDKIKIMPDKNKISKTKNNVSLNLGSIAKGYGVDLVSDYLKGLGFEDFMVEIGGEIYASGKNINKEKWKIGINLPDSGALLDELINIIEISDLGVATSGTYRQFVKSGKQKYSHIINPKTGYPADTCLVSVTVISKTCAYSDGLATGMLAMGANKAIKLCNLLENTECMTIESKNGFKVSYSKGFKEFLKTK
ncbi:MAG: FAD:protein FMN transferase [Desulforegulaceae bacterium]|nr:FAD:protein FMN transferase [Desulforegulaceae bacterium]